MIYLDGQAIPRDNNGNLEIIKQDQTTRPLDLFFTTDHGQPAAKTLAVASSIDDTTLTLSDVTGMADGQYFGVFGGDPNVPKFYFATQIGAPSGNIITVDSPLDDAFPIGAAVVPLSKNLAVDGTASPITFVVRGAGAGSDFQVDITRLIGAARCSSAVDLSKFVNLPALTKGLLLRRNDGKIWNIWNVKENSGFAALAFDWQPYSSTNPQQGIDGMAFRYTFNGDDKHGVTIRLEPEDSLELIVQDNLTTVGGDTINSFEVTAQGHVVD
jgi:hypothetical protein